MSQRRVNESSLIATADAIRAKAGTTDLITWVEGEGFKAAVEAIQAGGGGTAAPSAENVTFGNVKKVEVTTVPTGKAYYNGVLLPVIPEDLLVEYPYAWIRNNTTTGYYDLIMSNTPYYYQSSSLYEGAGVKGLPYYRVPISDVESATKWTTYGSHTFNSWGLDSARTVLWSNHDIPSGSATATDIYFEGTEPVIQETEIRTEYLEPVERLEEYTAKGDFLNEVAGYVQKILGTLSLFTPAEILDGLGSVKWIVESKAKTTLSHPEPFHTSVSGKLAMQPYWSSACYETTEGTSLTGTLDASAGDWILATVTTRSTTTFPEGWTVLRESTVLNSDAFDQRMAFLCKQATADGTESITIEQTSSARIYINMMGFSGVQGFAYHEGTEVYKDTEQVDAVTVARPSYASIVWGCSASLWGTSAPYGTWSMSPFESAPICLDGSSTQPRQANFVDEDANATERVFTTPTTTYFIVDCVEIIK